MNEVKVFQFRENEVRVVGINGEPWFVGKDVAGVLGYSDTQAMTRRLDADEVSTCTDNSSGQVRHVTIISESGLYNAVLGSSKPEAKAFKKWVTSEVLPSIRKHGAYVTNEKLSEWLADPTHMIEALTALKEEREKVRALEQQREVDRPKVVFAESVAVAKTSILVGEMAKLIKQATGTDIGQNRFFEYLRKNKRGQVKAAFLIRKDCKDYKRIKKIGKVVPFCSVRHKLHYLICDKVVSSAAEEYFMFPIIKSKAFRDITAEKKFVFLQHGIIKGDLSDWLNKYSKNIFRFITSTDFPFFLPTRTAFSPSALPHRYPVPPRLFFTSAPWHFLTSEKKAARTEVSIKGRRAAPALGLRLLQPYVLLRCGPSASAPAMEISVLADYFLTTLSQYQSV